jgi:flagellar protein FlgJ
MSEINNILGSMPLSTTPSLLEGRVEAAKASADQGIETVASEFESIFLSLMLKEMRNTLDSEEGGLFSGESSDTLGGMFDMFMSQHLAESNPLGISSAIESYMNNQQ